MSERWRRELTKLRQAPELPEDLWGRVRTGPRMPGARISGRTRAMTIALALAIAIPVLALAWISMRSLHGPQVARSGIGIVDVPPLGQVAPANLADGRPVFVAHHADGTVEVIDGFSTHVPWGLAKLIAWCSTSRTFDDVFHGARWNERGTYISGPAPTGLATYHSTIQPDGRLLVGSRIPPASRPSRGDEVQSEGPFCMTSANLEYPTMPTNVSDAPADVVAGAPPGWIAVRGSLIQGGSKGAKLCTLLTHANTECDHAAPVEGIDVQGLFGQDPSFVISGTFIARVQDGSLIDLSRVPEP